MVSTRSSINKRARGYLFYENKDRRSPHHKRRSETTKLVYLPRRFVGVGGIRLTKGMPIQTTNSGETWRIPTNLSTMNAAYCDYNRFVPKAYVATDQYSKDVDGLVEVSFPETYADGGRNVPLKDTRVERFVSKQEFESKAWMFQILDNSSFACYSPGGRKHATFTQMVFKKCMRKILSDQVSPSALIQAFQDEFSFLTKNIDDTSFSLEALNCCQFKSLSPTLPAYSNVFVHKKSGEELCVTKTMTWTRGWSVYKRQEFVGRLATTESESSSPSPSWSLVKETFYVDQLPSLKFGNDGSTVGDRLMEMTFDPKARTLQVVCSLFYNECIRENKTLYQECVDRKQELRTNYGDWTKAYLFD